MSEDETYYMTTRASFYDEEPDPVDLEKFETDMRKIVLRNVPPYEPPKMKKIKKKAKRLKRSVIHSDFSDGKLVKDINEFPEDLQIREVPWKGGAK